MAVVSTVAETYVIGGVDTHKDVHVAAVLSSSGALLGTSSFATTPKGYEALLVWFLSFGRVEKVGVEGTGSWGAGLSRFLQDHDVVVVEVTRQNRQRRRLKGKSDVIDAESAARAVLSDEANATPKSGSGSVESIRMLRIAQRSAVQSRSQAANQIHSLVDTAPAELREQLRGLSMKQLCVLAARFRRSGELATPSVACKIALRSLARRWLELSEEISELDTNLKAIVTATAPKLVALFGVGVDTAGALLVTMGDNPERCTSEAGFAALCGVSPMDASSGRNQRHRLNRGGDRTANNALWRVVMVRLSWHEETKAYMAKRQAEGKTKREAIRCLKRYVARQIWRLMNEIGTPSITTNRAA